MGNRDIWVVVCLSFFCFLGQTGWVDETDRWSRAGHGMEKGRKEHRAAGY